MITIIHGEDSQASYKHLSEIIDEKRTQQIDIIIKDATSLDPTTLRQESGATDLFGGGRCLVIKTLLSTTKSKQKDILIDIVKKLSDQETILYEPKKLTETVLKQFTGAKVLAFNISPLIFKFLDTLRPKNTRSIILGWERLMREGQEPEFVFAMLVRQIRLIIQAKSGASYLKLAPYPKKLITAQANYFDLSHLLALHQKLYEIDKKIKTGASPIPIDQLLSQFFYDI